MTNNITTVTFQSNMLPGVDGMEHLFVEAARTAGTFLPMHCTVVASIDHDWGNAVSIISVTNSETGEAVSDVAVEAKLEGQSLGKWIRECEALDAYYGSSEWRRG